MVADEVRNPSERSTTFNEQIRKLAHSSKDAIAKVRETVSHMACATWTAPVKRQEAAMLDNVAQINASLGDGMREVSECARAIDGSVAEAVRALQFEDIATQALGGVHHLDRLTAINREAVALQELLHRNGGVTKRSPPPCSAPAAAARTAQRMGTPAARRLPSRAWAPAPSSCSDPDVRCPRRQPARPRFVRGLACNPPLDASCTRTMTLIRALPALTDTERRATRACVSSCNSWRMWHARRSASCSSWRTRARSRVDEALLACLAWDLGLDGDAL